MICDSLSRYFLICIFSNLFKVKHVIVLLVNYIFSMEICLLKRKLSLLRKIAYYCFFYVYLDLALAIYKLKYTMYGISELIAFTISLYSLKNGTICSPLTHTCLVFYFIFLFCFKTDHLAGFATCCLQTLFLCFICKPSIRLV